MVMGISSARSIKHGAIESKPTPIRQFWHRHWMKVGTVVFAIAAAATIYFATGRDEKPPSYEQQVLQLQTPGFYPSIQAPPAYEKPVKGADSLGAPALTKVQVQEAERLFVGAQILKMELKGRPDSVYLACLARYYAMIKDISNQVKALGISPNDERKFFAAVDGIFRRGYVKEERNMAVDLLSRSVYAGNYDCSGFSDVKHDVAADQGKTTAIYFSWDFAPGIGQYGHAVNVGDSNIFDQREIRPKADTASLYPHIYGMASTPKNVLFATYDQLAFNLFKQGEYEETQPSGKSVELYREALSYYGESLKLNPDSPPALFGRGNCYLKLKNYREAEGDFRQAMAKWPKYFPAYNGMGILCQNTGRHAEAIEYFKESIKHFPSDPFVHYLSGLSYIALGQFSQADSSFRQSLGIKEDPKVRRKLEQVGEKLSGASR